MSFSWSLFLGEGQPRALPAQSMPWSPFAAPRQWSVVARCRGPQVDSGRACGEVPLQTVPSMAVHVGRDKEPMSWRTVVGLMYLVLR